MKKLQFLLPAVSYYVQRKDISTHQLELLKRVTAWGTKELKYLEALPFGTSSSHFVQSLVCQILVLEGVLHPSV